MSQPKWKLVAQLGDANPVDYGGYWVFEDTTGVYPPEGEYLEVGEEGEPSEAYRFALEPCTYIDGVLSDNPYHPDFPAWFADDIPGIARAIGEEPDAIIALFTSSNTIKRAEAWRMVGQYFGFRNLDDYPLTLSRSEARKRYRKRRYGA